MGVTNGSRLKVEFNGAIYSHYGNADMWEDVIDATTNTIATFSFEKEGRTRDTTKDFLVVSDVYTGFDIYTKKGKGLMIRASVKDMTNQNPKSRYYKQRLSLQKKPADDR